MDKFDASSAVALGGGQGRAITLSECEQVFLDLIRCNCYAQSEPNLKQHSYSNVLILMKSPCFPLSKSVPMMSREFAAVLGSALFFGASVASFAFVGVVELVPPGDAIVYGQSEGYGNSRGIYVSADTTFSISSLGEFGYPIGNTTLVGSIYASDGASRGTLLASSTASFPSDGTTMSWNDIPLNFTFTGGQNYVLDVGITGDYVGNENDLETYYWYYPSGSTTSFDVAGLLTVTHGDVTVGGISGDNVLIADFRVTLVPEPSTLALTAGGLLALGCFRRVKR